MKRPASFFNFAIFKSDLKRFWWVSALHGILIFASCLLPFYISNHEYRIGTNMLADSKAYIRSELLDYSIFPYLMLAVIAVGLAALLFSYLNSKSAVAQIHAVPVRRETLFITHALFGICALVVPVLVNAIILLFMRTNPCISQVVTVGHVLWWIFTQISYALIGFSFAVFIGMFTANSVAHIVFTYIFVLLPVAVEVAIKALMELHLHGYYFYGSAITVTGEFLYFGISKMCTVVYPLIYIAYSIILLALALIIYKLRDLENTAEVIAFPKLKPFFVYGVSLCAGVLGYFYLAAIADIESLFMILPFGILGLVIANMVAKKSFTLKGIIKPLAALIISAVAFAVLFELDITGFEKRVPDADDVESVVVSRRSIESITQVRTIRGTEKIETKAYIPALSDAEDIENVIRFHTYKTEDKAENRGRIDPIYVTYNLKGGNTLVRQYSVNLKSEQDLLAPIMETEEYKKHIFPVISGETDRINSVSIHDDRCGEFGKYFAEKNEDAEIINKICAALKKDIENAKYDEFAFGEATVTYIEMDERIPWYYEGTETLVSENESYGMYSEFYQYYVRPSYKNTIEVLSELGMYNSMPAPESYKTAKVRVGDFTRNNDRGAVVTLSEKDSSEADAVIDDPAVISELYRYVTETCPNRYDAHRDENGYNSFDITFSGENVRAFSVSRTSHDEKLPEALKKLINE